MVCIMRMLLSSPGNVSMIAAGSPAYSGSMYLSSVCRYLGKRKGHGVGKRRAKGAWRAKNMLLGVVLRGVLRAYLMLSLALLTCLLIPTCFLILTAHLTLSLASLAASVIILSIAFHKG